LFDCLRGFPPKKVKKNILHFDRGAFPCPVGAKKAKGLTTFDMKVDTFHCLYLPQKHGLQTSPDTSSAPQTFSKQEAIPFAFAHAQRQIMEKKEQGARTQ